MKFDAALDAIFNETSAGERTCSECSQTFLFDEADLDLSRKLRIPPPTVCPDCKRQRRLAFLNYTSLYKRRCDAPGHTEDLISAIPLGNSFMVYDYEYWNSYVWEPLAYGEVWSAGSFRDQFYALAKRVPQPVLTRHAGSVGSDYTLYGYNFKDCYFTFGGKSSENVHYSNWPADCKDSLDLMIAYNSTLSSNGVFLYNSYRCNWAYFSHECIDSDFLYDCRNVRNSFGCVNLRNKQYCFFNEQLTKEEYEKRRAEIDLGDRGVLEKYKSLFCEIVKKNPVRAVWIEKSENVSGNFVMNSKNCHDVVRCLNSENVHHSDFPIKIQDSINISVSANGEELAETAGVATMSSRVKFSYQSRTCLDSEFLVNCRNVSNCFGCVGLENKKFCILNTQHSEEEYFRKVDEIKTAMLEAGEYGEFFPLSMSPYAYNGSLAGIVFPLSKSEVEAKGAFWHDDSAQNTAGLSVTSIANLPLRIQDTPADILSRAVQGELGKAFRLIPKELEFYQNHNLALPDKHPMDRMLERFKQLNNFRIGKALCALCHKETDSMYDPKDGFTIYCESCFTREIS